jgi:phosphomannomutase
MKTAFAAEERNHLPPILGVQAITRLRRRAAAGWDWMGARQSLAQMRDALPAMINTPEVRFPSSEERKFAVVEEVKQRLKAAGAEVNDIDGVRVRTKDGWWLLRASNTQDVLVARCEAADEAGLERLKADVTAALKSAGATPPDW